MANTIYEQYLEAEVMNADPAKLVHMLLRGAIEAVGQARRHLAAKDIRERSRQIMRAWEILQELGASLDHAQGGTISRGLAGLYAYMQERLLDANRLQTDAPLAEVESLLGTIEEGWRTVKTPSPDESCELAAVNS